jgi:hypothetical protein
MRKYQLNPRSWVRTKCRPHKLWRALVCDLDEDFDELFICVGGGPDDLKDTNSDGKQRRLWIARPPLPPC